ncbi:MAG: hypothetical protein WCP22_10240 [Chlamydiota bacterium]
MIEESISTKSMESPAEKKAVKKALKKGKRAGKKAAKKQARKVAAVAAVKPVKKAAPKPAKKAKRGRKRGRKAAKIVIRKMGAEGAPSILVVGGAEQAEPVWVRYSQMTPAKPSRRPSVPTEIRVGNLVGWRTDSGKDRIGVVQEFRADCAAIGMGGRIEIIRICRLTKLADKVKEA